jgi:hypothetical protein
MGLDNIPRELPNATCNNHLKPFPGPEAERPADWNEIAPINCTAAAQAGNCVWNNTLGDKPGQVRGMLGNPCWYRGGYGNYLCDVLGLGDDAFYGSGSDDALYGNDDADGLSPAECTNLADLLEVKIREHDGPLTAPDVLGTADESSDLTSEALYAVAWLRFAADHGGSDVWS